MTKSVKSIALALSTTLAISACAKNPDKIQAAYVSPTTYSNLSCAQIAQERNRVVQKVNELSGAQKSEATKDAVATGVGLVLFWPALFILADTSDMEVQIANLKGHYDALSSAWLQKGCS